MNAEKYEQLLRRCNANTPAVVALSVNAGLIAAAMLALEVIV